MVKSIYCQLYYTQITDKKVTLPTKKNGKAQCIPPSLNNESWAKVTLQLHP